MTTAAGASGLPASPAAAFTPFHALLLASLYCAQGLPSGFLAHALPTLMASYGVPVQYIGLVKLLALPWFFKFLWAPLVDRSTIGALGDRRGWILSLQAVVIALLLVLSLMPGERWFGAWVVPLFALLLCINLAAATQDIATDGLAVRLLPERLRGVGNSLQVGGYKFGMIVGGNLLLMALAHWGWGISFRVLAALVIVVTVPVWLFHEPARRPSAGAAANAPMTTGYWRDSYAGFMARPGVTRWLAVLLTYKVADSLGSAMIKPLMVHSGYSLEQVAMISLTATIAGLVAALVAGGLYYRLGWRVSLVVFALLQAFGIGAWALLAIGVVNSAQVYAIAVFEQMADGMSTVALFALMMRYCRERHEGSDFTLQVSLHMVVAGLFGMGSGFLVQWFGYSTLFLLALAAGLLALIPLMQLLRADHSDAREGSAGRR